MLCTTSALTGALAGTAFEGILDRSLLMVGVDTLIAEALRSVVAAALAAVFVGLLLLVAYRPALRMRRSRGARERGEGS